MDRESRISVPKIKILWPNNLEITELNHKKVSILKMRFACSWLMNYDATYVIRYQNGIKMTKSGYWVRVYYPKIDINFCKKYYEKTFLIYLLDRNAQTNQTIMPRSLKSFSIEFKIDVRRVLLYFQFQSFQKMVQFSTMIPAISIKFRMSDRFKDVHY